MISTSTRRIPKEACISLRLLYSGSRSTQEWCWCSQILPRWSSGLFAAQRVVTRQSKSMQNVRRWSRFSLKALASVESTPRSNHPAILVRQLPEASSDKNTFCWGSLPCLQPVRALHPMHICDHPCARNNCLQCSVERGLERCRVHHWGCQLHGSILCSMRFGVCQTCLSSPCDGPSFP